MTARARLADVAIETDPSAELQDYAHPERLVTADWLSGTSVSPA